MILATVESNCNPDILGDDGAAWGMYQIHSAYAEDAGYAHKDALDPVVSGEIVRAYMNRYATEERLGRPVTLEDVCRIHNGGPNGYKRSSTDDYWNKCQDVAKRFDRCLTSVL